jgi:MATE family multidrug resistance protein
LTDTSDILTDRIIDRYPAGSYRQVLVLSLPAVLTMMSQTIMWTVDAAMVGHVGTAELAAVGLGGMLVWTTYSFFIGLTSAVNTFVAQAYGAHEYRRCGLYLWQGLHLALAAAAGLYVMRAFTPQIMSLLGPAPEVRALASSYVQIRMLSVPFFLIYYTYSHFFRGIGDTTTPLKILALANAVNIVADYLLIFGPGPFPALGVDGAAWATSLSNVVAAVLFVAVGFTPAMRRRYGTHTQWRAHGSEVARLMRVGIPIAIHFFLDMGSFLVFSAYISRMGTEPLAANQIAVQILALSFMPAQGFAIAATTLMGQYIGAGKPALAKHATYTTLKVGLYYAGFILLLCLSIPEALVRLFNGNETVVELGRKLIVLAAVFQVFDAIQFISDGGLRGAGDTRIPMMIIVGGAWFVFLPLAYLFGTVLGGGVVGAWAGAMLYVVVIAALMFARLKREGWRHATI